MNAIAHALPTTATHGALTLRGLSKAYALKGKPMQVLKDIELNIQPGEFVSIVGASGCGKSTLLRLIVGLDQDYHGQILLPATRTRAGPGTRHRVPGPPPVPMDDLAAEHRPGPEKPRHASHAQRPPGG